jgi:hypothetical protein
VWTSFRIFRGDLHEREKVGCQREAGSVLTQIEGAEHKTTMPPALC